MNNVILETEVLRQKLENLITLKGINHIEVLNLSRKSDKYILINRKGGTLNETIKI